MDIILTGVVFGLILAATIGPVFFKLVQTSIRKGWLFGFFLVIGISLSDFIYAFLAYFGLSRFINNDEFKFYLGLVGGFILMGYGIATLFKAIHPPQADGEQDHKTLGTEVLSGLLINGLNPFVLLFWVGVISVGTLQYEIQHDRMPLFLAVILITNFLADIMKVLVAHRIRRYINIRHWKTISRVVGIALFLFGLRLIYFAVSL